MKELQARAADLVEIYKKVSKDYMWKNSNNMNNMIALSHVLNDTAYKKTEIDKVNKYIIDNTSPFSCYRQKSVLYATFLYLNFPDPEAKFDLLLDYEQKLKAMGFRSYTYRPVTAYALLLTCEQNQIDARIAKAYEIFSRMRKNHPWLTSGDDYPLSILLAQAEKTTDVIMNEIEELYYELNSTGFGKSNGLQFLSHILGLSVEDNSAKAKRCREIYDIFKYNKMKVYSNNYASLGLLTLLDERGEQAAYQVLDLSKELANDRKFRWLGKETLFLTAASLVSSSYLDHYQRGSEVVQTTAFVTMEALISAQTAAILGATCTASAAASGS